MKEFTHEPQCDACGKKDVELYFMGAVRWDHTRIKCTCYRCKYIWFMKTFK